ncbi:hypothetical protein [Streptomyces omiyaensis]|uniref:hypothetical protein n=1 Tax=Streptomyces omiyaensis TaxID=68247 RepID=UPI001673BDD3|nr:hypothetical protein [Streptomyces omiyaensis]GGY63124.1 hypothetical protein GCM10010363_50680 [Streptomyces omiyaensis]
MSSDQIHQYGAGSVGKASHTGSGDIVAGGKTVGAATPATALDDLLAAVEGLRSHLDDTRRAELDAAAADLSPGATRAELEGPLTRIAGIAALVGAVGGPVVAAVQALLASLGA